MDALIHYNLDMYRAGTCYVAWVNTHYDAHTGRNLPSSTPPLRLRVSALLSSRNMHGVGYQEDVTIRSVVPKPYIGNIRLKRFGSSIAECTVVSLTRTQCSWDRYMTKWVLEMNKWMLNMWFLKRQQFWIHQSQRAGLRTKCSNLDMASAKCSVHSWT